MQPRRLRDRRRDPVPPRRGRVQPRRPPVRPPTGCSTTRETGGYNVDARARRPLRRAARRPAGKALPLSRSRARTRCEVIEKVNGKPLPEIKFFHMGDAHDRRPRGPRAAPRHGRAPGLGAVRPVGATARTSATRSSRPARSSGSRRSAPAPTRPTRSSRAGSRRRCPAIYTGDEMKPYRRVAARQRATRPSASLGGSFVSDNIEDYYLTPCELGYGPFVKFDHDFIGRDALEKMAGEPQRKKVTLAWNAEDVTRGLRLAAPRRTDTAKYFDLPLANYSTLAVRQGAEGRQDGRRLDVHRLQRTTSADALARDRRRRHASSAPR